MQFELLFNYQRARDLDENCLLVGSKAVPLRFIRHRRARRYVLRLCPDGAARVTVPRGGSAAEAKQFAERNLAWLEKQLLRQALQPVRAKTWVAGTEILFRGERVRLEIGNLQRVRSDERQVAAPLPSPLPARASRGEGEKPNADKGRLTGVVYPADPSAGGGRFIRFGSEAVRVPKDFSDLRPAIERHLWRLAARELPPRVFELASAHGFSVRRVTVRNQRSRWGSCSARGTI